MANSFPHPDELPSINNTDVASRYLHFPWVTSATNTVVGHVPNHGEQLVVHSNQEPLTQGEVYTLILIITDPVQDNRIPLHNLCHVAKHHGCNLEELHPEVFVSTSPSLQYTPVTEVSQPSCQRNRVEDQPFLDNFDMGNGVDGDGHGWGEGKCLNG